jgi:antitoxin VapB
MPPRKAKVFKTGRSQAIRLPKAFRFDVTEVFIRKDEASGDVILSAKSPEFKTWAEFFQAVRDIPEEERNLLPDRSVVITKRREPVF